MILGESDVLVLIPAWNEERSVGQVVKGVTDRGYATLVVDDGSHDGTANMAHLAGAMVLTLPYNMGVGGALRAGFRLAVDLGYSAIVQIDADGQHPIEMIPTLVETCNSRGSHMVIGSRFLTGHPSMRIARHRRIAMRLLARSASRAARSDITDATSGLRIIRQPLLGAFSQDFPTNYLGDTFEAVVAAGRAGYSISEVSTDMSERLHGLSSASPFRAAQFTAKALCVALLRLEPRITRLQGRQPDSQNP